MTKVPEDEFENFRNKSALIRHANGSDAINMSPHPQHTQYFLKHKREIFREFSFKEEIKSAVERLFKDVRETFAASNSNITDVNLTFIGVHNRRTDYKIALDHMIKGKLVSAEFFRSAMDVYKKRYGRGTVFIFASDDFRWTEQNFGDRPEVFSTHKYYNLYRDKVALDMVALASCDHSIFRWDSEFAI